MIGKFLYNKCSNLLSMVITSDALLGPIPRHEGESVGSRQFIVSYIIILITELVEQKRKLFFFYFLFLLEEPSSKIREKKMREYWVALLELYLTSKRYRP